jgi:hypothetical protein
VSPRPPRNNASYDFNPKVARLHLATIGVKLTPDQADFIGVKPEEVGSL